MSPCLHVSNKNSHLATNCKMGADKAQGGEAYRRNEGGFD